ncbi:MAG: hypothetical protein HY813_01760 [Candidatus Portnoybacteria bacterium]|nr:hypothetical protein [Candidatus Portnoybacteria bacterium]
MGDDEIVDFPINEYYSGEDFKYPKFPVVIYVRDKDTNEEKFHFQIDNVRENYYPLEIHKCGVYVIREFNYDPQKVKQGLTEGPGYKSEFWKYSYDGKGESLLLFHEITNQDEYKSYFSTDFRVDPREIYVALVRSYSGVSDYALVIRDLNTKTNAFVLLRQALSEKYPKFMGLFGLKQWTKDGSYFWIDLFVAAKVEAFLRFLRDVWKVDVLSVPQETEGGTALNPDLGYITYDTGPPWVGLDIIQEEIAKEWQGEGKIASFYLYNLFTKDQILLATTIEPFWPFRPQWLSDNELKYSDPEKGEVIYKIHEE